MNVALVEYGAGNLTSVRKAFHAAGGRCDAPSGPDDVRRFDAVVVPGVGHFGRTQALAGAWAEAVRDAVSRGVPLMGICLGMQWLFDGSDEAPDVPGLGALSGRCRFIDAPGLKVPHVGWNALRVRRAAGVLASVPDDTYVYFTHSFAAPITDDCLATSEHGIEFAAVVQRDNICGVQFHPEKSSDAGLTMICNFLRFAR